MKYVILFLLMLSFGVQAQSSDDRGATIADVKKLINDGLASKWYERIQMRGYAHVRYNRLLETNNKLNCSQCDKSIGNKQGFFFRRARLVFFGEVSDRVFVYIQPDYSSDAVAGSPAATQQNYLQLRDAYFDYAITKDKTWRLRTGLSKVPFSFESLQSSANRGPLDRSDAINSGVHNERDMGLVLMYAPSEIRQRFKDLTANNLKGSGDYGMIAFDVYNGQTMNRPEKNNDLHRALRLAYPIKLESGQFIELSLAGYEGKFNTYTPTAATDRDVYDQRTSAGIIYYPQPFGFQAEWNVGQGPEYNPSTNTVTKQNLDGGYAMINYQYYYGDNRYFPYIRYQQFKGGRKLETNATLNKVIEWEVGTEWQPMPAVELTAAYAISDRLTQSNLTNRAHEKGSLFRLQAQFNY
jgi:hypothetical protein